MLSILIFSVLSSLCVQGHLKPLWFTFSLLSLTLGYWSFSLGQLIAWILFLQPRIKNQPSHGLNKYPIYNAKKKARYIFSSFVIATGFFTFFLILFLLQQTNNDPTDFLQWGDFIALIVFSAFISLAAFLLTGFFTEHFLKISLFNKTFKRNNVRRQNKLFDHLDDDSYRKKFPFDENFSRLTDEIWENWDNDPANPASPTYQAMHHHIDPH